MAVQAKSNTKIKLNNKMNGRSNRSRRTDLLCGLILSLLTLFGLMPYLFMLATSLKDNFQFYDNYWLFSLPFHFENYSRAWEKIGGYEFNSFLVAGLSTIGVILLGSISAFVLVESKIPGRNFLFSLITVLMMVPSVASLIPLFILIKDLGLLNNYLGLIIPYIAGGTVLSTFLMRGFMEQIPEDLFEAARLDGASGRQIYWQVVMPLSGPIVGTVTMITLTNVWNDYFWPLLTITDDKLRTVSIGVAFFQGQYTTQWGPLFAGYVLASIPLLLIFTFASRYFIAGLQGSSGGGIKG